MSISGQERGISMCILDETHHVTSLSETIQRRNILPKRTTYSRIFSDRESLSFFHIHDCDRDPRISRYTVVTVIVAHLSHVWVRGSRMCKRDEERYVFFLASQLSFYPYYHMAGLVTRFKPAQGHACDTIPFSLLSLRARYSPPAKCRSHYLKDLSKQDPRGYTDIYHSIPY